MLSYNVDKIDGSLIRIDLGSLLGLFDGSNKKNVESSLLGYTLVSDDGTQIFITDSSLDGKKLLTRP